MAQVIYTAPRAEIRAAARLERHGHKVFVPLGRTERRPNPQPLFPRYIFAWLNGSWSQAITSGWIAAILKNGDSPAILNDAVVAEIQSRMKADGGSVLLEDCDCPKPREFQPGQPIRIVGGAYLGLDAIYLGRSGDRVIALLELLGGRRKTSIPIHLAA